MGSTLLKSLGMVLIFPFSIFFLFVAIINFFEFGGGLGSVAALIGIPIFLSISALFALLGTWLIRKSSKK